MPIEYAAIKSGLIHISKYITSYINDSRFRINCISPGGIFDNQEKNFLEAYKRNTFGTGMLEAEDVCGTVLFLLSDASKFINGQNIIVDDGYSLTEELYLFSAGKGTQTYHLNCIRMNRHF